MSNKINKSNEILKKEILKMHDLQHVVDRQTIEISNFLSNKINKSDEIIKKEINEQTRQVINSNIIKSNQNITKKMNYHFQHMLFFLNKTVSSQKFIQYNLTKDRKYINNYVHEMYLEIPIKYILPFYVPLILYFMYLCCKKYISQKRKKVYYLYMSKKLKKKYQK